MDDVPLSPLSNRSERLYESTERPSNSVPEQDKVMMRERGNLPLPRTIISGTMTLISHLCVCGITIYVICLSFQQYSLFSWHPSLMTLGCLLSMAEAVMVMSDSNLLTRKLGRHTRVRAHWILQALAATFIFTGFLIIVINKNKNQKPHFQTLHSIFGLITFILVVTASFGGVAALYSIRIANIIRPAILKLMHNISGIVTFLCGTVCLILGFYTQWFETHASYGTQVCCVLFVIIASLCTLQSAISSAYLRVLYMCQAK